MRDAGGDTGERGRQKNSRINSTTEKAMLVGAVPGDRYEFEFPGRDQKTVDRAGSGDCGSVQGETP